MLQVIRGIRMMLLGKVKGNYWITKKDDYVVMFGKKFWIFRNDGTVIACRPDLVNVYKVAFLPDHRLLVGGGRQFYHLISLKDGSEIWKAPQPRYTYCAPRFAISPDNITACDYYIKNGTTYFIKIDLVTGEIRSFPMHGLIGSIKDIMYDEMGIPCLLNTYYENVAGKQVSQNGILYQHIGEEGSTFYWKSKWQHESLTISQYLLNETKIILTNDLFLFQPQTGEMQYLLENEEKWNPPQKPPSGVWLDQSNQYLSLMYDTSNVVVDWISRKVVAQYWGEFTMGCIVNSEYWISSNKGILRNKFPLFEPFIP